MATWDRYAFAVLRGGVKSIPLAGGVLEEVLRVLEEERRAVAAEATGTLQTRTGAEAPPAELAEVEAAELERLAGDAWERLSAKSRIGTIS